LIAAPGKLLNGAALFESVQHFVQGVAVGAAHVETGSDLVSGRGIASNLKKTKDIIGA
jgi:hypothetical protein